LNNLLRTLQGTPTLTRTALLYAGALTLVFVLLVALGVL
jgi:hypothetical protein